MITNTLIAALALWLAPLRFPLPPKPYEMPRFTLVCFGPVQGWRW
jgi:hypothetical protein